MLTTALEDYLTRETPHQVQKFGTGEECLKHLHQQPDVIILDYYLNTVSKEAANGMEILKSIKKNYACIQKKFIAQKAALLIHDVMWVLTQE